MLRHFGKAFPDNGGGCDLVGGNVVTKFPAVSFEYHGRDFTSPVNCSPPRSASAIARSLCESARSIRSCIVVQRSMKRITSHLYFWVLLAIITGGVFGYV